MPPRSVDALRAERPDLAAFDVCEFVFPGPLRDQLVGAVLSGVKTATTALVIDYETSGDPLPIIGSRELVVDSDEHVAAVIEFTGVEVVTVGEVDLQTAIDEGEGFTSVAEWREGHDAFWTSDEFRAEIGRPDFVVRDEEPAVVIRFVVVERF